MVEVVLKEVDDFWSRRDRYKKLGLIWRRNLLLFGPPGTGKTLIVEAVARFFNEQGGFVANYHGGLPCGLGGALQIIRGIEPNRPILVIIEDVDQMVAVSPGIEQDLLQFLDGASKAENVVTIATTNYPKKLGERLLRPGRFDLLIQVPEPDTATKIGYLRSFHPEYFTDVQMSRWLESTKGLTFAELKEVVLQVLVYDKELEEASRMMRPEGRSVESVRESVREAVRHLGNYA
jgi:SpoVK/Ycf46/Vps4 family AAA+-type ATPase